MPPQKKYAANLRVGWAQSRLTRPVALSADEVAGECAVAHGATAFWFKTPDAACCSSSIWHLRMPAGVVANMHTSLIWIAGSASAVWSYDVVDVLL